MRALRGVRVVPVVKLTHRPMKTSFGMKHRPEFEIVGWKRLGGEGGDALPGSPPKQLTIPVAAPTQKPEQPTSEEPKPETPASDPKPKPEPAPASDPKPQPKASSVADATLAALEEVSMPTLSEELGDSIPW